MTNLRVGNAPCSWGVLEFEEGKNTAIPFSQMLDELAETGYTGTELGDWGYMPTDAAVLKQELERRHLTMLGGFVPVGLNDISNYSLGLDATLRVARLLAEVATEPQPFLVLADNNGTVPERTENAGRIKPSHQLSSTEWQVFAENANKLAREVRDRTGIRTAFHHHCAGFIETPEEIARFLQLTDPALVGLVFDTGHYAFGSGNFDVTEGLNRFRDRIWYVHLKDCSATVAAQAAAERWNYFEALRHGIFCELGRGQVDFPAVLGWLKRNQYRGYVVVEQDILPGMGTPKESALRNRNYLRSIE